METYMSLALNLSDDIDLIEDRSIQTSDEKIKKQLRKDMSKLIKKYELKGCHIV
jgi:hypothetical protein